jgi:hypothetical protein
MYNMDNNYLELKTMILELKNILELLIPSKSTISQIVSSTGATRQTITAYLYNNFEPEVDFWKENGKIVLSKSTALELLKKYNSKDKT